MPNGNRISYIEIKLTDKQYKKILTKIKKKQDYNKLPIKGLPDIYDNKYIPSTKNGYFKLEIGKKDKRDFKLTVLDNDLKKIYCYIFLM